MEKTQTDNKEWQIAGSYLMSLVRCALHDQQPECKPSGCAWEHIWALARKNNVECTVSPVIERIRENIPEDIKKPWKEALNRNLYRLVRYDMEREQIIEEMTAYGIACLPLKGILVSNYYPIAGMRWMCDNDILYGYVSQNDAGDLELRGDSQEEKAYWKQQAQRDLCMLMKKRGYTVENLKGNHDTFHKKPFFNFEMHHHLVPEDSEVAWYYANPWEKAIPVEPGSCQYRFSDEDEYLFLITHAHKHFNGSGCGIRTLVDEYVVLQSKNEMDWNYVNRELQRMGLADFEQKLRTVSLHAFEPDGQLSQDEWKMIFYMLGCGTYGTSANRVRRKLKKLEETGSGDVRGQYLRDRIWLSEKKMKDFFPFFYRHRAFRFLLPFYRVGKGMVRHPGQLISEWKAVRRYVSDGADTKIEHKMEKKHGKD